MKSITTIERKNELELVVTRNINGPARLGEKSGMNETFDQLEELLAGLGAGSTA